MLAAYRGAAVRRFSVKRAPGGDGWASFCARRRQYQLFEGRAQPVFVVQPEIPVSSYKYNIRPDIY
jgi:hypothetical protein